MKDIVYYDFDLDQSAETRWENIFVHYHSEIEALRSTLKSIISPYATAIKYFDSLYQSYPKEKIMHHSEICFVADKIKMKPLEVLILQLVYETSSACTSAIIQTSNGEFFFRTMDWPMDFLKNITIGLNIIKNGVVIGKAITWLGYLGFLTADSVLDDYIIAINYRRTKTINFTTLMKNLFRTINLKWPIGYLVRFLIEFQYSSSEARDVLITSELISPCYITMYIPKVQSCIITRDCDKTINIRTDNLIQTNCDWNKSEPNILWSVERREHMQKIQNLILKKYKPNDTEILDQIMVHPIINDETIYVHYRYNDKYKAIVL